MKNQTLGQLLVVTTVCVIVSACGVRRRDENPRSTLPNACSESSTQTRSEHGLYFARVNWSQGPTTSGESLGCLVFEAAIDGSISSVSDVTVTPWMSIHGHGTGHRQPEVEPVPNSVNAFLLKSVYFVMSGPWDLKVAATVNGSTDKVNIPVEVP